MANTTANPPLEADVRCFRYRIFFFFFFFLSFLFFLSSFFFTPLIELVLLPGDIR